MYDATQCSGRKRKIAESTKGRKGLKHVSPSSLHDQNHLFRCCQMIGRRCRKSRPSFCAWSRLLSQGNLGSRRLFCWSLNYLSGCDCDCFVVWGVLRVGLGCLCWRLLSLESRRVCCLYRPCRLLGRGVEGGMPLRSEMRRYPIEGL